MVGSREISREHRPAVQDRFNGLMRALNETFQDRLIARFTVTLGDEFQGILTDASVIPDILWKIEEEFHDRPIRVGIGYGPLSTAIPEFAVNVDGPALHQARRAIEIAKKKNRRSGVFSGFGKRQDLVLNYIATTLWWRRANWTAAERRVVALLRTMSQVDAATALNITKQAINDAAKRAAWNDYREGEDALRAMLKQYGANPEEA